MDNTIPAFIKRAIQQEVERVTEEELEEAKKRIEKRKAESIAAVVLYIEEQVSVQNLDRQLVITVRKTN